MLMSRPAPGLSNDFALLTALLAGESFWPSDPASFHELGLTEPFLDAMVCRLLRSSGNLSGRTIAGELCIPFRMIEGLMDRLKNRRMVTHCGSASMNDYVFGLTDEGRRRAEVFHAECAYAGPAPVPLADYVISVEAQAICDQPVRRETLDDAFYNVSVSNELMDMLGPAINSGSGLFLYGAPGNGKSTLARCLTSCFRQEIWIPYAIMDGREIITLFDPAYHQEAQQPEDRLAYDRRWVRVRRPTVIVGGELTLDSLEIRHDSTSNISEAPLQMKSNCGCLLIDDFGRQRVKPEQLLNRWIIPLENKHDYLTLATGKKIQVPFQQMIIFSTNLDPADLVDEAFLRRIPYRIEVEDPDDDEFHRLFQISAEKLGCNYDPEAVEHLMNKWYRAEKRPMRRCHARDLLLQIRSYCLYRGLQFEMLAEYFDVVSACFFTRVSTRPLSHSFEIAPSTCR
jgi:energy-coupling factor transporter ATP-binding protein EcfA2